MVTKEIFESDKEEIIELLRNAYLDIDGALAELEGKDNPRIEENLLEALQFVDNAMLMLRKLRTLKEEDLEKIRMALVNYYCFDCDSEPTFCPVESLLNRFKIKCQWG